MKYSSEENALVIELRNEGLIGQRLYNRFKEAFPERSPQSVRSKIEVLREKKVIR